MSQYVEINPSRVQEHRLNEIVESLNEGSVIAYPTDSGFALGCKMGLKRPLKKIKEIRNLDDKHNFTLICRDLSEIAKYAKVDNPSYRLMKKATPGHYTFILLGTSKVPSLTLNKSKKTVGIRIPSHPIPRLLTEALGEPIISTTLILPNESEPLTDADDVSQALSDQVNMIIDCGYCGYESTSVIDLTVQPPQILRHGAGDTTFFE